MPNWCENDLTIIGPATQVNRLLEFIAGEDESGEKTAFDFNKLIPYPEEYAAADRRYREWDGKRRKIFDEGLGYAHPETQRKLNALLEEYRVQRDDGLTIQTVMDGYNNGGYEWCRANWGTKWNACHVSLEERDQDSEKAVLHFETAWQPPEPVIVKLVGMFPELEFYHEYFERGMAFCGSAFYTKGELDKSSQGSYYGLRGG